MVTLAGLLAAGTPARADSPSDLAERLRKATAVLSEMASGEQDTDIPREVLAKARAVAVFPQVAKGATFRIDGRCASACTLVLAYWDRVCVTKRAVLGFHEARNRDGTRNQRVTDNMMAAYPVPVRDYISAHGGLPAPTNMMWVSGAALRGLLKPCE